MQRRQFLLVASLASLGSAVGTRTLMQLAVKATEPVANPPLRFYSASDNADGGHFLTEFNLETGALLTQPLPFRGHALLPLQERETLVFGRRPGTQCAQVNFAKQTYQLLSAADGRHFSGHGCLSASGEVLFTTENHYDGKRGIIGIRDRQTLQQLGEYETHGLDPHDIQLMPDGKTLVVANGGIETHPDFGRRKLNLESMQPSLVYIDVATGKLLADYRLAPADHQLSIRHLIVTAQGHVGVALQYEGNLYRSQPKSLVAWQTAGKDLKLLTIPSEALTPFKGYMADLAFDAEKQILAVTSPRGNHITFWDIAEQRFLHALALPEPSGISYLAQQKAFLVSDATGGVHLIHATHQRTSQQTLYQRQAVVWDNHLIIS